MELISFRRGQVIFSEGDSERWMYDILYGSVDIYSHYETPQQKVLTTLYSGDFLGEIGMIDNLPRSATAVAAEDTTLALINDASLLDYLKERPNGVRKLIKNTSSRLRDVTIKYLDVCKTISDYERLSSENQRIPKELQLKIKSIITNK